MRVSYYGVIIEDVGCQDVGCSSLFAFPFVVLYDDGTVYSTTYLVPGTVLYRTFGVLYYAVASHTTYMYVRTGAASNDGLVAT